MTWSTAERALVVIVDQSGSMASILPSVREGCRQLQRGAGAGTAVHYIAFATTARSDTDLERLRDIGGGTDIASAFKELRGMLARWGRPKKLDLVFISDGEDTDMVRCEQQLGCLPAPECPSRFFSVGVGAGFPTTLVTDHLYPKYGKDSDVSTPPVVPVESAEDAPIVFEQLAEYVHLPPAPPPRLEDFTEASTADELHAGARRAYNACMHGCLFRKSLPEAAGLAQCERILWRIGQLAMREAARLKAEARRRQQRLPSQLLVADREVTVLDAMRLAQRLRAQVRQCQESVGRSELLAALDNDAKRNIAGLAAR